MNIQKFLADNAERLNRLYAGVDQSERYTALYKEFQARFGHEPEMFVSAPGRTEVIGNHTDHQNGRVLAAAVNLDTFAAIAPREDTIVTMYSKGFPKPFIVDIADETVYEAEKETTLALIRGVAVRMRALGYKVGGCDIAVQSTVFKGSGLSSSAAVEVMLVAVFDALYNGWKVDAKENARISQYAENVYFGKPCGLMDQTASAVGGLVTIDFAGSPAKVEALGYDFGAKGYAVCVVSVGGEHGNLTADYAAMPAEMRSVAEAMGKKLLGEVTKEELMAALPALKGKVSDRALLRAFHFVDETDRVGEAVDALRRDDLAAFFAKIIESGESSWKLLQNLYVPASDNQEMPLALEISRRLLQGKGAWRIHGGGFAGTILAFVPFDLLDSYRDTLDGVFGKNATTVLAIRPEGVVYLK